MRKIKKGKQVIAVLLMMAMVVTSATACGSKKSSEKEQLVFRMAIVDGEASPIYKGAKARQTLCMRRQTARSKS